MFSCQFCETSETTFLTKQLRVIAFVQFKRGLDFKAAKTKYLSFLCNMSNIIPRGKYLYLEFFWFVFSRIRTEYGEIIRISPYSVRLRENTGQTNSEYGHFSRSVRPRQISPSTIDANSMP